MLRILLVPIALLAALVLNSGRLSFVEAFAQTSTAAAQEIQKPPKFVPPQITQTVDAAYPINSVAFGTVVVEVHVAASGEIEDVQVARDVPPLTDQALKAVRQWKFQAATLGGKPVASVVPVAFTFVRPDLFPRYGGQPKP